jgi:hypothetical protein
MGQLRRPLYQLRQCPVSWLGNLNWATPAWMRRSGFLVIRMDGRAVAPWLFCFCALVLPMARLRSHRDAQCRPSFGNATNGSDKFDEWVSNGGSVDD